MKNRSYPPARHTSRRNESGSSVCPGSTPPGSSPGAKWTIAHRAQYQPRRQASHLADLLAGAEDASRWLAATVVQWAEATGQPVPELRIGEADLAPLRRLRESVRGLADGDEAVAVPGAASVSLRFGDDGRVVYGTAATGWRGVAALVSAEILVAQRTGTWERFKACPFPSCGIAFYDQTRNNNRVWHDVRTCGNRTNLGASRQRRREAEGEALPER